MEQDFAAELARFIEPILAEEQADLVNLRIFNKGKTMMIDILADKAAGGITLEECSMINKKIAARMENENTISEDYCLMVSSPGIDWPLKTKKDFLRVMHRKIHFFLSETVEGRQEYVGFVAAVTDESVMIILKNRQLAIPLDKIKKGIQVIRVN